MKTILLALGMSVMYAQQFTVTAVLSSTSTMSVDSCTWCGKDAGLR